jgi:hypothetical protein
MAKGFVDSRAICRRRGVMMARLVVVSALAPYPPREAHERRTLELCHSLAEQACDITIVCFGDGTGVHWTRLARGVRQVSVGRSGPAAAALFDSVVRDACRAADVVLATSPNVLGAVASLWSGPLLLDLGERPADGAMLEAALRADGVLCASADLAEAVAAHGVGSADVLEVPTIVNPQTFRRPDRATRRLHRRVLATVAVVLVSGRSDPESLAAIRALCSGLAARADVHIVVTGDVCAALGAPTAANVRLLGNVNEDLGRWLHAVADVVLLPFSRSPALFDAVVGGASMVGPAEAFAAEPSLAAFADVLAEGGWPSAVARALERPDEESEARAHGAQETLALRAAPAPAIAPLRAWLTTHAQRCPQGVPAPHVVVAASAAIAAPSRYAALPDVVLCTRDESIVTGVERALSSRLVERGAPAQSFAEGAAPVLNDRSRWWLEVAFGDLLARSLHGATLAIVRDPYAYAALRAVWSGPVVYDAAGVDYVATAAQLADAHQHNPLLQGLAQAEGRCSREALLVVASCREDAELLADLYGVRPEHLAVCPPGLEGAPPFATREARSLAKTRSSLAGNALAVALLWGREDARGAMLLADVARAVPNVTFLVIGDVAASTTAQLGAAVPANLLFTGALGAEEARRIIGLADLAVHIGVRTSGISPAVAEYVGGGLPLVATPWAVRGWDLVDGADAHIVSPSEMPARIRAVLADSAAAEASALRLRERVAREGGAAAFARLVLDRHALLEVSA